MHRESMRKQAGDDSCTQDQGKGEAVEGLMRPNAGFAALPSGFQAVPCHPHCIAGNGSGA
jgi:hypothetical protein